MNYRPTPTPDAEDHGQRHRVFVYGTLKRGFGNHRLLQASDYLGRGRLENHRMRSYGAIPAIHTDPGWDVYGELYFVDDRTLARLDGLEGHPDFYVRVKVGVEMIEDAFGDAVAGRTGCFAYVMPHERVPEDAPTVTDGQWKGARYATV